MTDRSEDMLILDPGGSGSDSKAELKSNESALRRDVVRLCEYIYKYTATSKEEVEAQSLAASILERLR